MFTGIIQALGRVGSVQPRAAAARLHIDTGELALDGVAMGDSIAVNGVCLTVIELAPAGFAADVSRETLERTTLGRLGPGHPVNLERALTPASALGGHLVSGHVDGVASVRERVREGDCERLAFEVPGALARYLARKGSVCVDGVSLTVNAVRGARFEVQIIPHTLAHTVIGGYRAGDAVNIEVDLVARYVERLLDPDAYPGAEAPGITHEVLQRYGFTARE